MWELKLTDRYGLGDVVETVGPFGTLTECLDRFKNLDKAECDKQQHGRRWLWGAIGDETEEHKRQRAELARAGIVYP